MCHLFVSQVLLKMPFLRMSMAAGLCSSRDESSPVHGYKQMLPDSASVTGNNRLHIEYSCRKGFAFCCCSCCLGLLWGVFFFFTWFFFSLVCWGFFLWCRLHINTSIFCIKFPFHPMVRVTNRVCKCKTTFSIGSYNKIANVSFVSGSMCW